MPFPHNQEQFKQLIDIANEFIRNESWCVDCDGEYKSQYWESNLTGKISQLRIVFSSMIKNPRIEDGMLLIEVNGIDISIPEGLNRDSGYTLCFGEDSATKGLAHHLCEITDVSDFYSTLFANLISVV